MLVNNFVPGISQIKVPATILEGIPTTMSASATYAENDNFTYSWLVDNQTFTGDTIDYTFADDENYPVTLMAAAIAKQ